nr:hypothetical protein [uncultured Dongia sp.]
MVRLRDAASFEAAALAAIHFLGAEQVAAIADRGTGSVRNWTNPDHDGRPTIHNCLQIDAACLAAGNEPPFLSAYAEQLKLVGRGDDPKLRGVMFEALELGEAVGGFHGLVCRANDLGSDEGASISPTENAALTKALKVAQKQLDDVRAAIAKAAKNGRK